MRKMEKCVEKVIKGGKWIKLHGKSQLCSTTSKLARKMNMKPKSMGKKEERRATKLKEYPPAHVYSTKHHDQGLKMLST